jgi:hypothetical protein
MKRKNLKDTKNSFCKLKRLNLWRHKELRLQEKGEPMKLKEETCNRELLKIKEFGQRER